MNATHFGKIGIASAILVFGSNTATAETVVFFEDFSSGATSAEFSGEGFINTVGGYAGLNGFADNFWVNGSNPPVSTNLSLTGLAAHSTLTITFDLALIDSWDGNGAAAVSQDFFNATLDGTEIFEISVDNAQGIMPEVVPATATNRIGPAQLIGQTGSFYNDSGFTVSITISHSASTALFNFFADGSGWQGGFGIDESWAIDNIRVVSNTVVPVPAAVWLFGSGLGLLGWFSRKKK